MSANGMARPLQDQDIQNKLRNDSLSPAQERRYKKLKDDIISEVKSLRLNQARIDALVEQLLTISTRRWSSSCLAFGSSL
jgi:RNA polymerase primary sigma factor